MYRSTKSVLRALSLAGSLLPIPSLMLSANTDSLRVRLAEATQLTMQDKRADARILLRQIVDQYPDSPEAYNNLAVLLAYGEDCKGAIALLKQALATSHSLQVSYSNLNLIYRYQAAKAYRSALENDKTNPLPLPKLSMLTIPENIAEQATPRRTQPNRVGKAVATPSLSIHRGTSFKRITTALRNWVSAWSMQDVDAYLASYVPGYVPDGGIDHQGWRVLRRERILKPAFIEVLVDNESINVLSPQHALVTFTQYYRSATFSDAVRKFIVMQHTDAGWLISREHVIR